MRLAENRIKQGLLHPEQLVRDAALRYFSESFSRDPSVMPLAIQAVETHGWDDAFESASGLRNLVQTEQTFGWLTDRMEQVGYPETPQAKEVCLRLSAIITNSATTLLARHRQAVQSLQGLYPEHRRIIANRLRLLTRDGQTCWRDLEAWCQRHRRIRHIDKADVPAARRLVEAIARDGQPHADRVLSILSQKIEDYQDNPMVWMECFAAHLAGELRLEAAALLLAAKLREDGGDMLNEECMYSLTKIGTDTAVAAICDDWADAPEHFKLYASSALQNIHTDAKVARCLAMHLQEEGYLRVRVLRAVLASFATEGIEPARQLILDAGWGLHRELVATAVLAGVGFPELEQWLAEEKADADSRKQRRREMFAPAPRKGKGQFPSIARLTEPPPPPLVTKKRVGRNDPCPCGSGKKYKKCCMGKE